MLCAQAHWVGSNRAFRVAPIASAALTAHMHTTYRFDQSVSK